MLLVGISYKDKLCDFIYFGTFLIGQSQFHFIVFILITSLPVTSEASLKNNGECSTQRVINSVNGDPPNRQQVMFLHVLSSETSSRPSSEQHLSGLLLVISLVAQVTKSGYHCNSDYKTRISKFQSSI